MTTTLSMWLGMTFVLLGIVAVLLQAWLWNPKYWDEVAKKTHAPRAGLIAHRIVGYTFAAIYVVMMYYMLPRLWEYQVELPARTVMHAVAAIVLGVLLFTKITILLFFRHFEESMPKLGMGILMCTIVIGVLSIPYAYRASDVGGEAFEPANVARVEQLLEKIDMEAGVDRAALVTEDGLARGRQVLVGACVRCHDMRTILAKPRSAQGWYDVNLRMTEKPSVFGEPIDPADVPYVTAYLVAITPEIQESRKLQAEQNRERKETLDGLVEQITGSGEEPTPTPAPTSTAEPTPTPMAEPMPTAEPKPMPTPKPKPKPRPPASAKAPDAVVDAATGKKLLAELCTSCHELDEVENHGGDDLAGWAKVVHAMVGEGADITNAQAKQLVPFLAATYPKK